MELHSETFCDLSELYTIKDSNYESSKNEGISFMEELEEFIQIPSSLLNKETRKNVERKPEIDDDDKALSDILDFVVEMEELAEKRRSLRQPEQFQVQHNAPGTVQYYRPPMQDMKRLGSGKKKTHQCVSCDLWFTSEGFLQRHLKSTVHKNRSYCRRSKMVSQESNCESSKNEGISFMEELEEFIQIPSSLLNKETRKNVERKPEIDDDDKALSDILDFVVEMEELAEKRRSLRQPKQFQVQHNAPGTVQYYRPPMQDMKRLGSGKKKTHQCVSCDLWFTSEGFLQRHLKSTVHKNRSYCRRSKMVSQESNCESSKNEGISFMEELEEFIQIPSSLLNKETRKNVERKPEIDDDDKALSDILDFVVEMEELAEKRRSLRQPEQFQVQHNAPGTVQYYRPPMQDMKRLGSGKKKTHQCVSCDLWFTSEGFLQRHLKSTVHKNRSYCRRSKMVSQGLDSRTKHERQRLT
ncbi:unnamed protein product [Brassicogethes aeneus]|uniref:C2H2-type domain-containing protein n=1 Tax=Brassicogethes aeneus TaxID=1431903 RepID=A0A9P0BMW0_BRAAE|nr:unnamed protein product [Brassicogethes aeneus]